MRAGTRAPRMSSTTSARTGRPRAAFGRSGSIPHQPRKRQPCLRPVHYAGCIRKPESLLTFGPERRVSYFDLYLRLADGAAIDPFLHHAFLQRDSDQRCGDYFTRWRWPRVPLPTLSRWPSRRADTCPGFGQHHQHYQLRYRHPCRIGQPHRHGGKPGNGSVQPAALEVGRSAWIDRRRPQTSHRNPDDIRRCHDSRGGGCPEPPAGAPAGAHHSPAHRFHELSRDCLLPRCAP